jgi:hypothetical protein
VHDTTPSVMDLHGVEYVEYARGGFWVCVGVRRVRRTRARTADAADADGDGRGVAWRGVAWRDANGRTARHARGECGDE